MTIQSSINGNPAVSGSRDVLDIGDVVTLSYTGVPVSTYTWSLEYVPVDVDGVASTAALSSISDPTTQFIVDLPGAYLVKLVVDIGLGTEAEYTARLRALVAPFNFRLSAAGEFFDPSTPIPTDATPTGWADDVNRNFLIASSEIEKILTTIPFLAPRTTDSVYVNPDGTGDYTTIQDAINTLTSGGRIYLAASTYVESLTFPGGKVYEIIGDKREGAAISASIPSISISGSIICEGGSQLFIQNLELYTPSILVEDGSRFIASNIYVSAAAADTFTLEGSAECYLFDSFLISGADTAFILDTDFSGVLGFIRGMAVNPSGSATFVLSNADTPNFNRVILESVNLTDFLNVFSGYVRVLQISHSFVIGDIFLTSTLGSAESEFYSQMTRIVGDVMIDDAQFTSIIFYAYSTIYESLIGTPTFLLLQPATSISQTQSGLGSTVQEALITLSDASGIAYTGAAVGVATTVEEAFETIRGVSASITTLNDAPTSIPTDDLSTDIFRILADGTKVIRCSVTGDSGLGNHFAFLLTAMFWNNGGTMTIGSAGVQNDFTDTNGYGVSATLSTDGTQVLVDIQGVAATAITWNIRVWAE